MRILSSILRKMNIRKYGGIIIPQIVEKEGKVERAIGSDTFTLEPFLFEASSVILAIGGAWVVYCPMLKP